MTEYLVGLNPEQLQAVKTTEGYVRVIAGAGSGKTKALTSRYTYIVDELGIMPSRILCVTFTNKAANEMKQRVQRNLGGGIVTPYIMTFHGFCNRFLRDEIDRLGFSNNFKIVDTEDQLGLLKTVYEQLGLGKDDAIPPKRAISDLIGAGCKTGVRHTLKDYEVILTKYTASEIGQMGELALTVEEKIIFGYLSEQKLNGCLDYDDLLNLTLYLLQTKPDVLATWEKAFDYIQVDEFQDVSLREVTLLGLLARKCNNLFVVGDGDQTIYSWRGADVNCINQFGEIMTQLVGHPVSPITIFLNTNYRSTGEILDVSNSLIAKNVNRLEKSLVPYNATKGAQVIHFHGNSVYDEAKWVVMRIKQLTSVFSLSDIAVLYRSNMSSRAVEEKLVEASVPYEVLSGVGFYQRKEIKDVLAVLSVVAFRDNISFLRVIKTYGTKIGPKKIEFLKSACMGDERLVDKMRELQDDKQFKSTNVKVIINLLDTLFNVKEIEGLASLLSRTYSMLNLEAQYAVTEPERWENLQELKKSVYLYEKEHSDSTLEDYLGALALLTEADANENADKVKLMTVHAAKGLEYNAVFVIAMNEDIIPSSRTMTADALEEERRIAYVAMTRAKQLLFLTDAGGQDFNNREKLPSRFLFDIQRDYIKTEGIIPDYILRLMNTKVEGDKTKYGSITSNILDSIIDNGAYKEGERVIHQVYGVGTIVQIVSEGLLILFDTAGPKGVVKDSPKLSKFNL